MRHQIITPADWLREAKRPASALGHREEGRWQEETQRSHQPLTFWFVLCVSVRLGFGLLTQALLLLVFGGAGCK